MIDRDNMSALSRHMRDSVKFTRSFNANVSSFAHWQSTTLAFVVEALGLGNAQAAQSRTIVQNDHNLHQTRLLELTFSSGEKTEAFLLLPSVQKKSPAVLLLHDHGSCFDIGKEKLIKTASHDKACSAHDWIKRCYGGRYLGEILVKRGYVVLCADALGWSSRQGNGYDAQQALAANLMQFGTSLASVVALEDMEAALFLSQLPEVDERFVASMGFSFGGFRAWQVAALTSAITASVAINWMGQLAGLMTPGANLLRGQSAYYMLHPPLAGKLDYPDIVGLIAPRPALFYAGDRDPHFPCETVEAAFAAIAAGWETAKARKLLETKIWSSGHEFNAAQQDAAIDWLDAIFDLQA